jgi:hypothetical protein
MSTTFERATRGYDEEHERALLAAIVTALFEASRVSDAQACVVRTGEAASALVSALALVLAVSPAAARSPTAIRRTVDELAKRIRSKAAAAVADSEVRAFKARGCFNGTDVGDRA